MYSDNIKTQYEAYNQAVSTAQRTKGLMAWQSAQQTRKLIVDNLPFLLLNAKGDEDQKRLLAILNDQRFVAPAGQLPLGFVVDPPLCTIEEYLADDNLQRNFLETVPAAADTPEKRATEYRRRFQALMLMHRIHQPSAQIKALRLRDADQKVAEAEGKLREAEEKLNDEPRPALPNRIEELETKVEQCQATRNAALAERNRVATKDGYRAALDRLQHFYQVNPAAPDDDNDFKHTLLTYYERGVPLTHLLRFFPRLTREQFVAWMNEEETNYRGAAAGGPPLPAELPALRKWRVELASANAIRYHVAALLIPSHEHRPVSDRARIVLQKLLVLPPDQMAGLLQLSGQLGAHAAHRATWTTERLRAAIEDPGFQQQVTQTHQRYQDAKAVQNNFVHDQLAVLETKVQEPVIKARHLLQDINTLLSEAVLRDGAAAAPRTHLHRLRRRPESKDARSPDASVITDDCRVQIEESLLEIRLSIMDFKELLRVANRTGDDVAKEKQSINERLEALESIYAEFSLRRRDFYARQQQGAGPVKPSLMSALQRPAVPETEEEKKLPAVDYVYAGAVEHESREAADAAAVDNNNLMLADGPDHRPSALTKDSGDRYFVVSTLGAAGLRNVNDQGQRCIRIYKLPQPPWTVSYDRAVKQKDYELKMLELVIRVLTDHVDGEVKRRENDKLSEPELRKRVASEVIDIYGDCTTMSRADFSKYMIILCELHGLNYRAHIDELRSYSPSTAEKQHVRELCAELQTRGVAFTPVRLDEEEAVDHLVSSTTGFLRRP